jgi:uncharacterized protein
MTESEKLTALRLARNAIESELLRSPLGRKDQLTPLFSEEGAVFVTIKTKEGALRGCVGSLIAHRSLYDDIIENSLSSAFKDPRFPPLNITELPFIKIEISLLKTPSELNYSGADDLLNKIVPNEDGLIIKYEDAQATFLPSVWEEISQKEEFISRLCQKAGLEADFWKSGKLEIYVYKAEKFSEQ